MREHGYKPEDFRAVTTYGGYNIYHMSDGRKLDTRENQLSVQFLELVHAHWKNIENKVRNRERRTRTDIGGEK